MQQFEPVGQRCQFPPVFRFTMGGADAQDFYQTDASLFGLITIHGDSKWNQRYIINNPSSA